MRVDRLLSIMLILKNKGKVTAKDLAEHFEVSVRTIYRDMDKISQSGVPIAGDGGKGGGYYILESYDIDNLFFNKGELQIVKTVMNSLEVVLGKNKQFNDILMKVDNAVNSSGNKQVLSINMSHFSMEEELKEYLATMSSAIAEDRLIVFEYINRNMELVKREVEPIRIEFSSGQWYLIGFCRYRKGYRKFKLVRISKLSVGEKFTRVNNPSPDELQEIFIRSYDDKLIDVTLLFDQRIGQQLSEYFHKDDISKNEDGTYIVTEKCPYDEGLFRFILGFGNNCKIISPQWLREDMKKYINKILKNYND